MPTRNCRLPPERSRGYNGDTGITEGCNSNIRRTGGTLLLQTSTQTAAVKAAPAAGEQLGKRPRKKPAFLKCWQLYVLLIPVVAYFVVFHYMPMYGVQIAFRNYDAVSGFWGSPWVGLDHFKRFFDSYYFWRLLKNTIAISLTQLLVSTPVAIILALMINEVRANRFKKAVQLVTYAPHFISYVVIVGMLMIFLDKNTGVLNLLITALGGEPQAFMTKADAFLPVYVLSGVWQHMGWNAIIYISALAGVDPQLLEAASVDGAGRFRKILHVNLPCIMPTIITLLILNCGSLMSLGYEKAYLMQNDLNRTASDIISTYTYTIGVNGGQYSYSAAIGLFNSVVNCILLVLVNTLSRKLSDTSLW